MASITTQPSSSSVIDASGVSWSNIDWIFYYDGFVAACTVDDERFLHSNTIRASGFAYSIPAGSTIVGFELMYYARADADAHVLTSYIRSNTSIGSVARTLTIPGGTAYGWRYFGGPTDMWGWSWTVADVNSGFNVEFVLDYATGASLASQSTVEIDLIYLTVFYNLPNTTGTQTITGKGKLVKLATQTRLGRARISQALFPTRLGRARVSLTNLVTRLGRARINSTNLVTRLGVARINAVVSPSLLGRAKINITSLATRLGKATVRVTALVAQLGRSRIQKSGVWTQLGISSIRATNLATLLGRGRTQATSLRTLLGRAAIADATIASTRTQLGRARIQLTGSWTQTGISRINAPALATIQGRSRVSGYGLANALGRARVSISTLQNQLGRARVSALGTQSELGRAAIRNTSLVTRLGRGRIQFSGLTTLQGRARLANLIAVSRLGKAAILARYDYSWESVAVLPTDDEPLANGYQSAEVDDAHTLNLSYVDGTGTSGYLVHLFKDAMPGGEVVIGRKWVGRVTIPPSESTVYLQIYNYNSSTWETVASTSTGASPVTLSYTQTVNVAYYKNAFGQTAWRVYQEMV